MLEPVFAHTPLGTLEGRRREGTGCHFRGVRYAEAPVGERRFASPVPVSSWTGVRAAVDYGPVPHQLRISEGLLIPDAAAELNAAEGEDCLSVNIVTPAVDGLRPVMVYIHGGNFVEGAGSQQWTDPSRLSAGGDVVTVSVNYRLGPLGWLFLDDLGGADIGADNNLGLRDQIAALEWVRDNIHAFGGDPDNVTLFGYSAGAWSISALMAAGLSPRLFQKAIVMSGGVRTHSRAEATALTRAVLDQLGVRADDLAELRDIPAERFAPAMAAVWDQQDHPFPPIRPVADGELLPLDPLAAIAAGAARGMRAIVGSTLDEFKLVATADLEAQTLDEDGLVQRFSDLGVDAAQALVAHYREARAARGESVATTDLYWALDSDRMFSVPGVQVADAHCRVEPDTWMYQVRWRAGDPRLGACHSVDLGLVFDGLDLPGMEVLTGTSAAARELSHRMMDSWSSFARTGDPNHQGMPDWPRYELPRRATMVLDDPCYVVDAPLAEERKAWEGVI